MSKSIPISFKDNKEEKELLEWVTSKSSVSGFTKDLYKKEKLREEAQDKKYMKGFITLEN